jgi:GntR family transcriptional repressor for pyruvate dehydrogenase complex
MQSKTHSNLLVQTLKNDIIEGTLKPGDRLLPLRELANKYEVSRSVINCVVSSLVAQGYITVLPRHYIVVNDILNTGSVGIIIDVMESNNLSLKLKLLKDVLVLRKTIEVDSLRKIMEDPKGSLGVIQPTMALIQSWMKNPKNELNLLIDLDAKFHQSLLIATHNTVYGLIYNEFEVLMHKMISFFYQNYDLAVQNFQWYLDIYEALIEKNESKAISILEKALDLGATYVLRLIK